MTFLDIGEITMDNVTSHLSEQSLFNEARRIGRQNKQLNNQVEKTIAETQQWLAEYEQTKNKDYSKNTP